MKKIKPSAILYKDYVIKLHECDKRVTIILDCKNIDCRSLKEAKKLIDTTIGLHYEEL